MSGTALSRAQLLTQVRASFSQKSAPPGSVATDPAPQTVSPTSASLEPQVSQANLDLQDQLEVLDKAITEVEENVVHRSQTAALLPTPLVPAPADPTTSTAPTFDPLVSAMSMAVDQSTQTLNPVQPTPRIKEVVPAQPSAEQTTISMVESATSAAPTEAVNMGMYQEMAPAAPEIPPEILAYLQEVKNHQEQLPHEIVIANNEMSLQPAPQPLRPVVVLPITPEIEKQGAHKSPALSIRWLVEWSRRLMKMFTGKIVYQEP